MKRLFFASAAFAALSFSSHALTLPVSEDTSTTTVLKTAKGAGKATTLPVTATRSALMRFEVSAFASSIAAGDVTSARLVFYVGAAKKPGDLTLHAVTSDWSEVFVAPLVVPTIDGTNLATITAANVVAKQFVIVDVTAQVKAWLTTPASDFGFAISTTGTTNVTLGAKEGSGTGYPATLEIDTGVAGVASIDGSLLGAGTVSDASLGTGLDAAKFGSGSVSNTEFNYLAGVTSNIQTQFGSLATDVSGKVSKNGDSMTGSLGIGASSPAAAVHAVASNAAGRFELTDSASTAAAVTVVNAGAGIGLKLDSTSANSGSSGIEVNHAGVGAGVNSTSQSGTGVRGATISISSAGVLGANTAGGEAVVGLASHPDSAKDGNGVGAVVGRNDLLNGYGVRGFVTRAGAIGVLGQGGISGGANIAGRFENVSALNTSDVLQLKTSGTGKLLTLTKTGTGEVASFSATGLLTLGANALTVGTNQLIATGGSVGILNAAPETALQVGDYSAAGDRAIRISTLGGNSYRASLDLRHFNNGNGFSIVSDERASGPLGFQIVDYTGGVATVRMFIDKSGNVGIGRTPTANKLEVEGNASKTTATSWLANSDRRIKADIRPVTGALETIERVRPVTFRYTEEYRRAHPSVEDREYWNVIAQEFREVFPDAVRGSGEHLADGSEILQVDTYPATITALGAIKELNAKHDAAMKAKDAEIAELKARLDRLEQLITK